jgi:hypothetical protein
MATYVNFTNDDVIIDTTKVTTGIFSGGVGTLAGSSFATASLSTAQKRYYYNMQYQSADQFSVTYGHKGGSGSYATTTTKGKTEAIYKSFATLLLLPEDVDEGFIVNEGSTATSQSDMYFIVFERARMKDRVNRENWTLGLSGSTTAGASTALFLTDNSKNTASVASPVGPRYTIRSGSAGNTVGSTEYGFFYPNVGVLALSQAQLSSSIGGTAGYIESGSPYIHGVGAAATKGSGIGLARDASATGQADADNAGKLVNSILAGRNLTFRSEEDQVTTSYFCRARAGHFNFSNNPTFTSGSDNQFLQRDFESNPQTFITTVGLYTANEELVAVGRLSSAVQKNYSSEAVIKVNLTY